MQPTPLQPRRANLKLLLASCFTERALWNTPSSPLPLHLTQPVASGWVRLSRATSNMLDGMVSAGPLGLDGEHGDVTSEQFKGVCGEAVLILTLVKDVCVWCGSGGQCYESKGQRSSLSNSGGGGKAGFPHGSERTGVSPFHDWRNISSQSGLFCFKATPDLHNLRMSPSLLTAAREVLPHLPLVARLQAVLTGSQCNQCDSLMEVMGLTEEEAPPQGQRVYTPALI
ncbi:hypothetical protein Q8A73_009343 [Channa argus]|nr:hypothetical protein Q8A73_009343 [Channa argus]